MSDENEFEDLAPDQPHPADVIAALNAENVELKDKLLRALAETENTRRRAEREKADASTYAVTRFAREMLTIADNFARALAHLPPAVREAADPQVQAVIEGVEATERQLLAALENYGIKQIDTSDGKFDPNLHQAIISHEKAARSYLPNGYRIVLPCGGLHIRCDSQGQ